MEEIFRIWDFIDISSHFTFMTFYISWHLTFHDIWHFMTYDIWWDLTFDISWQLTYHDIWHLVKFDISFFTTFGMDGWDEMGGYLRFPPDPILPLSLFNKYPNKDIITLDFHDRNFSNKSKTSNFHFPHHRPWLRIVIW